MLENLTRGLLAIHLRKQYSGTNNKDLSRVYIEFSEIHAQQSTGGPPLGPILGAKGIPLNKFNDDFNKVSSHIKSGVPLNCKVEFEGAGKSRLYNYLNRGLFYCIV